MQLSVHSGGEGIGGSCVEVQSGKSRIVVDVGIPIVGQDGMRIEIPHEKDVSGPELLERGLLPNVSGLYQWDTSSRPGDGVLISHAHMDHYGWIRFVQPDIPIYLGEATKALIQLGSLMTGFPAEISNPRFIERGKVFDCGEFRVTPFLTDHSAFDAYAFVIEAEGKRVIYSGDFREHGRKPGAFRRFLEEAPREADALILEGTLVGNEGHDLRTEQDIEDEAVRIAKASSNAVLLYFASQNIDRLVSFYKASIRSRRLFVIDVYTALVLDTLVATKSRPKLPYPSKDYSNIRVMFPHNIATLIKERCGEETVRRFANFKIKREEIAEKPSRIMMSVRPSMIRHLERIDNLEGATFIYSLWQGYMDEPRTRELKEYADRLHMRWEYLHTTGHAPVETLKNIVNTLKPRAVIPIHTLHPQMYSAFCTAVVQLRPGRALEL